jgi:hypothetical protein
MAQSRFGLSALNQTLGTGTQNNLGINQSLAEINSLLIPVRVYDIILDETHPKWSTYGGWNGLGTIEFKGVYTPDASIDSITIAKPLFPQLKNYPLVNEIVLVFKLPNQNIGDIDGNTTYYYLNPIGIWNHPHHNAYPNPITGDNLPPSQQKDYQDIEGGSVRRVKDNSTEINLNSPTVGGTFIEKINIHPLLSFAGDNIFEGRFGNSIRLGNTSKTNSSIQNNWSGVGENGDPITILRNGQDPNSSNEGWVPIVENINKDLSSIYLTSTQRIPLIPSSTRYGGLSISPINIEEYNKPQILFNSNRIVLNSKEDDILLSSKKHINLSSEGDMSLGSGKKIVLNSSQIKLGSKTATESVLLGDSFMQQFSNLLNSLDTLCSALEKEPQLKLTPTVAGITKESINNIKSTLESLTSDTVKTI